jgi:predicted nucleic acid-binding protein
MSEIPFRYVVDASVGIKLFVEEEFSDKTQNLFARLASETPAELHVPDLFYIECANILLKYTRRYKRPIEDSRADLADLNELALQASPTADLMEDALTLAYEKKLREYDACYVILAQRLDVSLITADEALVKAIERAVWIGDLKLEE